MSATAVESRASDEILLDENGVSLCLLLNRRAKALRVIDFRSGMNVAKRSLVMDVARREGVERVYTLVEREEASAWSRLGFTKEGNIPGYYKRSDALILGAVIDTTTAAPPTGVRSTRESKTSGTDEHERRYQAVRKLAKHFASTETASVKVQQARRSDVERMLNSALRSGRAMTAFERFGRGVERLFYSCTARGGFSLLVSVEIQPCFNNAFVELLTPPRSEKEAVLTSAAVGKLCEELNSLSVVGCFAVSPAVEVELGAAFAANQFRRTGVLSKHCMVQGARTDGFLWSRKLAQPDDE